MNQVDWNKEDSRQLIAFYRKAVATPSFSGQEGDMARLTQAWMEQLGYDRVWIDSAGNVAGQVGHGPRIIHFDSHMDTVQVPDEAEWTAPPFEARVVDGMVYGRGSVDMKGGLGISGIANLLCCIKMAKYYEFTAQDVVVTVLTDSAALYQSRIQQPEEAYGPYDETEAALDYRLHLLGLKTDSLQELTYAHRKRIHNLNYYTWVEQQGKSVQQLNDLWYGDTWQEIHSQAAELDELICAFNEATGLLKALS